MQFEKLLSKTSNKKQQSEEVKQEKKKIFESRINNIFMLLYVDDIDHLSAAILMIIGTAI
jgi:acetylglutamate synthase